jgi:hypothetical protein
MDSYNNERRREQRLRYHWPVWFAEDFNGTLSQGQMVDVSSGGAAFTCYADTACPYPGQKMTARFSVPRFDRDDSFDMASFTRDAHILRVEEINKFTRRVAVQFAEPLSFRPGEQVMGEEETAERMRAVTI